MFSRMWLPCPRQCGRWLRVDTILPPICQCEIDETRAHADEAKQQLDKLMSTNDEVLDMTTERDE